MARRPETDRRIDFADVPWSLMPPQKLKFGSLGSLDPAKGRSSSFSSRTNFPFANGAKEVSLPHPHYLSRASPRSLYACEQLLVFIVY